MKILDPTNLEWKEIELQEKESTRKKKESTFKGSLSGSKTIKTNASDLYLVGDMCIKIDLTSGDYSIKHNMATPRNCFGLCNIGRHLYVIGGETNDYKPAITCESFNLKTEKWVELSKPFPDEYLSGITVIPLK